MLDGGGQDRLPDAGLLGRRSDGQSPGIGPGARRLDGRHRVQATQDLLGTCPILGGREFEAHLDRRPTIAEQAGEPSDGPLPDEPAGGEDPDPIADGLDLGQEVAREQDGQAALVDEGAEEVEDLDHPERVDGGRRLIEDEDVGRLHQRVGDAEALLHATRIRFDAVVGAVGQADLIEDLVHRRFGLFAAQPVEAGRVTQVLATGETAVEADGVREVADAPLHLARVPGRIEPGHAGLAARRLGEAEEHEDRGGLAGAVLPEQAEDLAGSEPPGRACRPRSGCRSAS